MQWLFMGKQFVTKIHNNEINVSIPDTTLHHAINPIIFSAVGYLRYKKKGGFNDFLINTWFQVTSPAYTELEVTMMDWLAKALKLPQEFLSGGKGGGVIQVRT